MNIEWPDEPLPNGKKRNGRPITSKQIALLVTLRKLATQSDFYSIGMEFDIATGTAYHLRQRMMITLLDTFGPTYFPFPTTKHECGLRAEQFTNLTNTAIPGIVGALDGCHIRWVPARFTTHRHQYFNRKGYCSIVAIAIVDALTRFTFMNVSCPGSCHDAWAYQYAGTLPMLDRCVSDGFYVVADSAFPISHRCLTPFRRPIRQQAHSRFNTQLSRARVQVERAFGLLKGRWRCLRELNCKLELVPRYVFTCALLHNICIDHHDICDEAPWYDEIEQEEIRNREQDYEDNQIYHLDNDDLPAEGHGFGPHDGEAMRDVIVNHLG